MAAGLAISAADFEKFAVQFEAECNSKLTADDLEEVYYYDMDLDPEVLDFFLVEAIEAMPWGQEFPIPVFKATFDVNKVYIMKEKHQKLELIGNGGKKYSGLQFNVSGNFAEVGQKITVLYTPQLNRYNGTISIQLLISKFI